MVITVSSTLAPAASIRDCGRVEPKGIIALVCE
jgi:hypothetical protein